MAYVYTHSRKDNGKVFYVGKGSNYRVNVKSGRGNAWNDIVDAYGYTKQILIDGLGDEEALELESLVISTYGLDNLINTDRGGIQPPKSNGRKPGFVSEMKGKTLSVRNNFAKDNNISIRTVQRWANKENPPRPSDQHRTKLYNELHKLLTNIN